MPVLEAGLAASGDRRAIEVSTTFSDLAAKRVSTLISPVIARFSVQHVEAVCLGRAGGSQSGSQRVQPPGYVRRHPACVAAVQRHIGRRQPTFGYRLELIWEQEAAGSNPAIPTKHAGRKACYRLSLLLPRSFDRHLTVALNANRRQRRGGAGWCASATCCRQYHRPVTDHHRGRSAYLARTGPLLPMVRGAPSTAVLATARPGQAGARLLLARCAGQSQIRAWRSGRTMSA
jgi:hypothetical protein